MNTALLIIDVQNDYFPDGKMELEGSPEAAIKARKVLDVFRKMGKPVVHIQHLSLRPGSTFFIPDTKGAEIHESVKPIPGEMVIQKNYPNSFRDTPLLGYLKQENIDKLVIAGMMTHMCVDATVRAAFDLGFQCTLLHDACATRALGFGGEIIPAGHVHGAFISALAAVYARAVCSEDFIKEAENSQF